MITDEVKEIITAVLMVAATVVVVFLIGAGVSVLFKGETARFFAFAFPMAWVCFLSLFFFIWRQRNEES